MRDCVFCLAMMSRKMCPTLKCDFFVNRQRHKVLYVKSKRRPSKYQMIMDELGLIRATLDKMGK